MTDKQRHERAAALVVTTILETLDEMGDKGAPLGIMYAALSGSISHNTFMTAITALQTAGIIKVNNNVAHINKFAKGIVI